MGTGDRFIEIAGCVSYLGVTTSHAGLVPGIWPRWNGTGQVCNSTQPQMYHVKPT